MKQMVDHPTQLSLHIPIHPEESLLEQLASCLEIQCTQFRTKERVHIECPAEVTSNALKVPQRIPCAMESEVSNSCDQLEPRLI